MFTAKSQEFAQYLDGTVLDFRAKSRSLSFAVAAVLAACLPVPAEAAEGGGQAHFAATFADDCLGKIGCVNEIHPLGVAETRALVAKFYELRYNTVHNVIVMFPVAECLFDSYCGANRVFSEEEMAFANDNATVIIGLMNKMKSLCLIEEAAEIVRGVVV